MRKQRKVFVIGLDGATFDLIGPWIESGKLPTLSFLIERGVSGPLLSTYPPLTGPAWSSFMTGKSPTQHGILDFFRRRDGSYQQILNNRTDIDGASLWHHLREAGKQVGIIGLPLTYPPEPVNGFMITGLLTPAGCRDFTFPTDLLDEIEARFGEYYLRLDEKYHPKSPLPFIEELHNNLENNSRVAQYLMTHKPWDFFMVHFYGTDRIQHELWHMIDPNHPDHDPEENARLGNVIEDFFIKVDRVIGRLLKNLDDETMVIIMSDHGFGPIYKFININTWLLQEGFLCLKNKPSTKIRHKLWQLGFNYIVMGNSVLKFGFGRQTKRLGRAKREKWQRKIFLSLNDVDWSKTKVYSIGNFGQLFINLVDREPFGIVSPGDEYEEVLNDLIQRLSVLEDPETKHPVIEKIMRGEEVYQGKFEKIAPNLVFYTKNMEYKAMGLSDFSSNKIFEPVFGSRGHHRMNGILICYAPGIFKEGAKIENARIYDLAPTILYLMGQKIPKDMDGKVLLDIFDEPISEYDPPQFQDIDSSNKPEEIFVHTKQNEKVLVDMMRRLGYMD